MRPARLFYTSNHPNGAMKPKPKYQDVKLDTVLPFDASSMIVRDDIKFTINKQMMLIDKQFMEIADKASARFSISETAQKYISLRSTLFPRLFGEIYAVFNSDFYDVVHNWKGTNAELLQLFKERITYNSLTVHPTEGRTLGSIRNYYYLTEIAVLMAKVNGLNRDQQPTVLDAMMLKYFYKKCNSDVSFTVQEVAGDFDLFNLYYTQLVHIGLDNLVARPLGHYKKMSKDQEIELLLFWGSIYRMIKARISHMIFGMNKQVDLEQLGFLNDTTWAGDRDGKEEIDAYHYCNFEWKSQIKFLDCLKDYIEILMETYVGYDRKAESLAKALELVDELKNRSLSEYHVFNYSEAREYERKLISYISEIAYVIDDEFNIFIDSLMSFIRRSNIRIYENGFTSREETAKIHKCLKNIINVISSEAEGGTLEDRDQYERLLNEYIRSPKAIVDKLVHIDFNLLEHNTQKQIACHIASLRFHEHHEHIISNFDSSVQTYKEHILLDRISRLIAQDHKSFPFIAQFYESKDAENNISFYNTIFGSEESIECIVAAKNYISTLAEDMDSMVNLVPFYKKALEDEVILEYLKGIGEVRITISKSDGSESTGNYLECHLSTSNIIEIERLCDAKGLKLNFLLGVGGNDPERGAYSESQSIRPRQTIQGADISNFVNLSRTKNSLLRPKRDLNHDALEEFLSDHQKKEFMEKFTKEMYSRHKKSYFGIESEYKGEKIYSGRTLFRGPIVMDVQKILGRASARGDTRKKDKVEEEVVSNTPFSFKDLDKKLRRIGEVNTNRIAGVVPFLFLNYFDNVTEQFDKGLLKELHTIPMFRDIAFNAIMAIASSDVEIFLLNNGFTGDYRLETDIIRSYSELFTEIYNNYNETKSFEPAFLRKLHISHILVNLQSSLRNLMDILLIDASEETKHIVGQLCSKIERMPFNRSDDLFKTAINVCAVAADDKLIDKNLSNRLRVTTADIYYKALDMSLRRNFVCRANEALHKNNSEDYFKAIEQLAQLIRGSGNPFGKGSRHDDDLLKYYEVRKNLEDRSRILGIKLEHSEL